MFLQTADIYMYLSRTILTRYIHTYIHIACLWPDFPIESYREDGVTVFQLL